MLRSLAPCRHPAAVISVSPGPASARAAAGLDLLQQALDRLLLLERRQAILDAVPYQIRQGGIDCLRTRDPVLQVPEGRAVGTARHRRPRGAGLPESTGAPVLSEQEFAALPRLRQLLLQLSQGPLQVLDLRALVLHLLLAYL